MSPVARSDALAQRSLAVLLEGQSRSGAFIASPSFPVYHYAWLRDGAFCAHALDLVGEPSAARAFHAWVAETLLAHRSLIEEALARVEGGERRGWKGAATPSAAPEHMPPARYTLRGTLEDAGGQAGAAEPWPNFQLDGYGMWLWALAEHLRNDPPQGDVRAAAALTARYLAAAWNLPCFDCWEEWGGGEHASTLGAVVAGLEAAARILAEPVWGETAQRVRAVLRSRFSDGRRLRRGAQDDRVDGSLLWLGVPFGVLEPGDALLRATVDAIREDLAGPGGGLYRYRGDTYFGGGQWLLLTSSLAWHDAVAGEHALAAAEQAWVRAQATDELELPEQVTDHALSPAMVQPWRQRWGPVATPLLWSHAMYLIAEAAVG
jgi:isomaltose glucohydrolase